MKFKPMLADSIENIVDIKYPVLASYKYDGIRAMMQEGKLVSRKLKLIPNKQIQEKFAGLPEGIDGELLAKDPTDKHAMQNTSTAVMSRNKDASDVVFYVFDIFDPLLPFHERLKKAAKAMQPLHDLVGWYIVQQEIITNEAELLAFEEKALDLGYEGVMVRSMDGPYKQGRATVKQGWLLKLKRFVDAEAEVLSVYEEMENTNEAKKDALGHTERSSHKSGMVAKGRLGGFNVAGLNGEFAGVEFSIGSGLTGAQKDAFWKKRKALPGKIIRYKYFPVGTKDKPRLPIFQGFRDPRDM